MAVQTVACPGCKATLKAPEQMAGKKAKCKKCGVSFRIPGGDEPTGDSAGDSQFLSAMDLPAAAPGDNPFDFGDDPEPASKPVEKEKPAAKKAAVVPKAEPVPAKKSTVVPKPEPKAEPVKPVAKSPPKPPKSKPKDEEEDIPAAAAVEDDEPVTTASSDPFSFSETSAPAKGKDKVKDKPKETAKEEPKEERKNKKKEPTGGGAFAFGDDPAPAGLVDEPDEEEEEDDKKPVVEKAAEKKGGKRNYAAKGESGGGGSGRLIIAAVVFALIVGGIVGGVLIYLNGNKQPEQANNEKKNPDPPPPTPPVDPIPPPNKGENPKPPDTPNPKDKDKGTPPKKDPPGKKTAGGGPMLALAPGRVINFLPQAAKLKPVQEPSNRLLIVPALPAKSTDAFTAAVKVFPPHKRDTDIGVVWQTEKGLQGVGEKLFLGIYSPQTGKQANQVAFDGDGSAEPVCDLSADANLFAHAHTGTNKVTIWDSRAGAKVVDGFDPYATKKDLKLAAVYLTEPPLVFVTVSTTGAVHAFNVKSKEPMAGEFVPMRTSTKPLVAGKHIAPGPNRLSVIVYSGGSFYSVDIGPTVDGKEVARLDGDVGRSFGIAGSGGGKLLFAFETDDKKDKAVMEVRPDGKHLFYRWPEKDAGEPTIVAWVDDGLAMVGSSRGSCIWYEAEGTEFKPIALARTLNDKGRHVASDGHWTLLPDPANPKQCVLVEYSKPQSGIVGALGDSVKALPIAMLTDKGLLK